MAAIERGGRLETGEVVRQRFERGNVEMEARLAIPIESDPEKEPKKAFAAASQPPPTEAPAETVPHGRALTLSQKRRYRITGSLWMGFGSLLLFLDNVTGHIGDAFFGILDIVTAFSLLHGYRQLKAARVGYAGDLSWKGTWREVKKKAHEIIDSVVKKLKKEKAEQHDLRWWRAS